jgi:hypothetical protein
MYAISCFPKRFNLSQIITPIIDNRRLIVQNSSIITYFFIPSGKGKRLIVLHAGTQSEGLIDGCDLVFLNKSKDGDYHHEMNSVVFLEWFENQLMPALKNPSLNYTYH